MSRLTIFQVCLFLSNFVGNDLDFTYLSFRRIILFANSSGGGGVSSLLPWVLKPENKFVQKFYRGLLEAT